MKWETYGLMLLVFVDPIASAIALGALIGAIGGLDTFDDAGLIAAIADVKAKYTVWQDYLKEQREKDEKEVALERIASEERALRVLAAFPLKATAEAQERFDALLDHLNDPRNIDYYRFAVWNERSGSTNPTCWHLLWQASRKVRRWALSVTISPCRYACQLDPP